MTEQSYRLTFTDGHRFELDRALGELMENAQKLLETRGRLSGLARVTQAVIERRELPVVLRRVLEAAVELVGARYGALSVLAPDGSIEQVVDVRDGRPGGSALEVPLRAHGEVLGTMYLCDGPAEPFTPDGEQLLSLLAATAATALDDARAAAEMERRQRWSTALTEVTSALLSGEPRAAFELIADRVRTLADADLVSVVREGSPEFLVVELACGPLACEVAGLVYPSAGTVTARALQSGRPVISDSSTGTPGGLLGLGPTAVIPMPSPHAPRGALVLSRGPTSPRFSDRDVEAAAEFAAQAGAALGLAAAREDRQRMLVLEDRDRIARDLHDHVIQRLFAAGLGLQAAAAKAPDPQVKAKIADQVESLDEAIVAIRTAVFALTSNREQPQSIRRRVTELVRELSDLFSLSPRLAFSGPADLMVSGDLADDLLAALREGLTNVARHARARQVAVCLSIEHRQVLLRITDDGVGMGRTGRRSGIENLERRAVRRGGAFRVEGGTAGGTELSWCAPIDGEGPHDPGVPAR